MEKGRNIKANFLLAREHECWPGSGKRYMYITYFHTRMYGCKQPGQSTTSLLTCERPQKKDPSKSFMECRFQRKSEQFLAWGSIRLTLSRWPNEVGSTMIWVGFNLLSHSGPAPMWSLRPLRPLHPWRPRPRRPLRPLCPRRPDVNVVLPTSIPLASSTSSTSQFRCLSTGCALLTGVARHCHITSIRQFTSVHITCKLFVSPRAENRTMYKGLSFHVTPCPCTTSKHRHPNWNKMRRTHRP